MDRADHPFAGNVRRGGRFPTTRWSLVMAAGEGSSHALGELYRRYCYPLYAFARRSGAERDSAEDLIQGFFARSLEKVDLAPEVGGRGRFRTWILASFKNYRANVYYASRAAKRSADLVSLDVIDAEGRYLHEVSHDLTPERLYHRAWTQTLLSHVLADLESSYQQRGKSALFNALKSSLVDRGGDRPYSSLADELGMSEGAVRKAAHDLREYYRKLLLKEVAHTLENEGEATSELTELLSTLE